MLVCACACVCARARVCVCVGRAITTTRVTRKVAATFASVIRTKENSRPGSVQDGAQELLATSVVLVGFVFVCVLSCVRACVPV